MQVNTTGVIGLPQNAAIAPYLRVIMTSGYLALAGANDREIGTAAQRILTTGLGAVECPPVVLRSAPGTITMVANGVIAIYGRVYGGASGKVSATANGNFIGWALQATTADGDEVEVARASLPSQKLYTSVAASAEHENTTTEAAFDKSYTIPANVLTAGTVIHVVGQAYVVDNNSTDTLTLALKIGTTTVAVTAAVDVADGDIGYFDAWITIRTAGASGTLVATGVQGLGVPGTVTAKPFLLGSTAVDTTATQLISVTADWSAAHADDEVLLDVLNVFLFPA